MIRGPVSSRVLEAHTTMGRWMSPGASERGRTAAPRHARSVARPRRHCPSWSFAVIPGTPRVSRMQEPTRRRRATSLRPVVATAASPVSSGRARDGAGADRVIEYLMQQIDTEHRFERHTPGLPTLREPPTVHLAEGTSEEFAAYVERALQLINTALPVEKRILLRPRTGAAPNHARAGSRWPDLRRLSLRRRRTGILETITRTRWRIRMELG